MPGFCRVTASVDADTPASHDLRQPMHALSLYLATMQSLELAARALPVLDNVNQCASKPATGFANSHALRLG